MALDHLVKRPAGRRFAAGWVALVGVLFLCLSTGAQSVASQGSAESVAPTATSTAPTATASAKKDAGVGDVERNHGASHQVTGRPVHIQANCEQSDVLSIHCGLTPSVKVGPDGRLHAVFVQRDRVYYTHSDTLGARFSAPVAVNNQPEPIYSRGENRPKIALGPDGQLYVSWSKKTEGRFNGDIRFSRSTDGGNTFATPYTVNDDGLLTTHRFDALTVAGNGDVYLAWIDKRDRVRERSTGRDYAGAAIYYAVSTNGGQRFGPNEKVIDHSCECCRIAAQPAAGVGDGVELMWRHIFEGGIRDHARVTLGGGTDAALPEVHRASVDDWQINACPHHGPAMAGADRPGDAHMVWFTNGDRARGIQYGRFDGDANAPTSVTSLDATASASHPDIARHRGTLYTVYKKTAADGTRIMLRTSADGGGTWNTPTAVAGTAGASDYPFVLSHPDGPILTWKTEQGFEVHRLDAGVRNVNLRMFERASLAQIEQRIGTQRHVLMLWSTDCPPCFKDLAILNELQAQHGVQPVTLVATDSPDNAAAVHRVVQRFALNANPLWLSSLDTDQLRAAVDAEWFGELPRTYVYVDGARTGYSGQIDRSTLAAWLNLPDSSPDD